MQTQNSEEETCLAALLRSELIKYELLAGSTSAAPRRAGKVYFRDILLCTIQRMQKCSLLSMMEGPLMFLSMKELLVFLLRLELHFTDGTLSDMADTVMRFCEGAENMNIPPAWKEVVWSYERLGKCLFLASARAADVTSALELFRQNCATFGMLAVFQRANDPLMWGGVDYSQVWTSTGFATFNLTVTPGESA